MFMHVDINTPHLLIAAPFLRKFVVRGSSRELSHQSDNICRLSAERNQTTVPEFMHIDDANMLLRSWLHQKLGESWGIVDKQKGGDHMPKYMVRTISFVWLTWLNSIGFSCKFQFKLSCANPSRHINERLLYFMETTASESMNRNTWTSGKASVAFNSSHRHQH